MKPSFTDWCLSAFSLLFTGVSVFILLQRKNLIPSLVFAAVFFGFLWVVSLILIYEKVMFGRNMSPSQVDLLPGNLEFKSTWVKGIAIGFGFIVIGWVGIWAKDHHDLGMNLAGIGSIVIGVFIGLAVILGSNSIWLRDDKIIFRGSRYTYVVPWDLIRDISVAEFHGTPQILINVVSLESLLNVNKFVSPHKLKMVSKALQSNRKWLGAEIIIKPSHYGRDAAHFLRSLLFYWQFPEKRKGLMASQEVGTFIEGTVSG